MDYPHQIDVYEVQQVRVPGGGTEDTPVYIKTVEAHVLPITGNAFLLAQQLTDKMDFKVFIPYEEAYDITSSMFFKRGDTQLDIVGPPKNLGSKDATILFMCQSVD